MRDAVWRLVARGFSRNWVVRRLLRWACVHRRSMSVRLGMEWALFPGITLVHFARAEAFPGMNLATSRAFILWGSLEVMGPDRTLIRQYGSGDTVVFRKGTVSQIHGVCESRGTLCLMVRYGWR